MESHWKADSKGVRQVLAIAAGIAIVAGITTYHNRCSTEKAKKSGSMNSDKIGRVGVGLLRVYVAQNWRYEVDKVCQ